MISAAGRKTPRSTPYSVVYAYYSAHFALCQARSPTVIAAAITSQTGKARLPTHIAVQTDGGLAKNSVILLEQIRTIDKRRLKEKMGHLDDRTMKQVNEALYVSFGLTEETAVSSPA